MNYLAILVCAIVSMVIGSIWYGPVFGKMFMKEMGMDQWTPEKQAAMKKKMGFSYFGQFVASLVMFYVLSGLIAYSPTKLNPSTGMGVAFFVWLGFVVPLAFGNAIWGGKFKLFWLNIGNMLLTLLAAGAILGGWR